MLIQLELLQQSSTVRALITLVAGIQCRLKCSTLPYQTLIRALSYAMWEDQELQNLDHCILQDAHCLPTYLPELARKWALDLERGLVELSADLTVIVIPAQGDSHTQEALSMLQRWTGLSLKSSTTGEPQTLHG
jgi:hypothetical protein